MTESSKEKTVRNFINLLDNPYFEVQITIFYNNYYDKDLALEHKPIITKKLKTLFPEQCFLYRLCLFNTEAKNLDDLSQQDELSGEFEMPYHTFFTNKKISLERLSDRLTKHLDCSVRIKQQSFGKLRKIKYTSAVKKGKPFNLQGYFSTDKQLRRYEVIGKKNIKL